MIYDVEDYLSSHAYPGRGMLIGGAPQGGIYAIYFIMGRSANSRNRIFVCDSEGVRTQIVDPTQPYDPSLIIYRAMELCRGHLVLSNGDHTADIVAGLEREQDLPQSLAAREFEPDAPLYTPRLSALLRPDGSYSLSIIKSSPYDPGCCCWRQYFNYQRAYAGVGQLLHTYQPAEPGQQALPSFSGEPLNVSVEGRLADYAGRVWRALDEDNRVALLACHFQPQSQAQHVRTIIINKYQPDDAEVELS